MSDKHLSFITMSDLCDNALPSIEEKEAALGHIESCSLCRVEYTRLKSALAYCRDLGTDFSPRDGFCDMAMKKIRWRRKKKNFLRAAPAIAASVLIIIGVSFHYSNFFAPFSDSSAITRHEAATPGGREKVLDIISRNNAQVLRVSDDFIEGRVPVSRFNQLRRELGFRSVTYRVTAPASHADHDSWRSNIWRSNIENVGAGNTNSEGSDFWKSSDPGKGAGEAQVIFRVFR